MSNCMTIDDAIDKKETCTETPVKDVIELILEEALLTAFVTTDKGCSPIGDFTKTDELRQPHDQLTNLKEFDPVNRSQNQSGPNLESNFDSGEDIDRSAGVLAARENLESIIDSFVIEEEKPKPIGECVILNEEALADSELQIQNGKTRLETNKKENDDYKTEFYNKEDSVIDDTLEIEYFNEGKLNKIYVPFQSDSNQSNTELNKTKDESEKSSIDKSSGITDESSTSVNDYGQGNASLEHSIDNVTIKSQNEEKEHCETEGNEYGDKRPFEPYTTDELRQSSLDVWKHENAVLVESWESEMSAQKREAIIIMEKLSTVQMLSETLPDPNRPRACAFHNDDIEKMTKGIQDIKFAQNQLTESISCIDGQGDADLETHSFAKSKDSSEKSQSTQNSIATADMHFKNFNSNESSTKDFFSTSTNFDSFILSGKMFDSSESTETAHSKLPTDNIKGERHLQYKVTEEESLLQSRYYNNENKLLESDETQADPVFRIAFPPERMEEVKSNGSSSSNSVLKETTSGKMDKIESITKEDSGSELNLSELPSDPLEDLNENTSKEIMSIAKKVPSELEKENVSDKGSFSKDNKDAVNKDNTTSIFTENDPEADVLEKETFLTKALPKTESSESKILESDFNFVPRKHEEEFKENKKTNEEPEKLDLMPSWLESKQEDEFKAKLMNEKTKSERRIPDENENESNKGGFFKDNSNLIFPENRPEAYVLEKEPFVGNVLPKTESSGSKILESDFNFVPRKPEEEFEKNKKTNEDLEKLDLMSSLLENKQEDEVEAKLMNEKTKSEIRIPDDKSSTSQIRLKLGYSKKSFASGEESDIESSKGDSTSDTQQDASSCELTSEPQPRQFKLHSPKMYSGHNYELAAHEPSGVALTDSQEAFIDMTENVIQIIEPSKTSSDEDSSTVSFSLPTDLGGESPWSKTLTPSETMRSVEEDQNSNESIQQTRKMYSGMTTIGPIKYSDHDPKDLTAPDIDFGKMTRITSSRQLATDIGLFSPELTTGLTVKILEENSSEENISLIVGDDDHADRASLVNRDIASLTKVQKVREVMSYQPKPEEDFEDEETLPRPRLDLKDVESMTDERYKVPDVNIPLLSFEIGDVGNVEIEKDIMESMGLVISGCTEPVLYDEAFEEKNLDMTRNQSILNLGSKKIVEASLEISKTSNTEVEIRQETEEFKQEIKLMEGEKSEEKTPKVDNTESKHGSISSHLKCSTLSSAFRKASSKFIRKDSEILMRNSKSLPRNTSKITTSESIRTLLDDCQSSAANVLKKSRSVLKNTQSLFKSLSQSRMTGGRDFDQDFSQPNISSFKADAKTIERKLSSFLKREDISKAKSLIKNTVEKTLKTFDVKREAEEKEIKAADKNDENLKVDRLDSLKKLLPKSPLVYKSQFVKSQASFQTESNLPPENQDANEAIPELVPISQNTTGPQASEVEDVQLKNKTEPISSREEFVEEKPPDFIVMETIEGLPTSDLDSPSSEKENVNLENSRKIMSDKEGNEIKKLETTDSVQALGDKAWGTTGYLSETEDDKSPTKASERKSKTKKKFSAKFRSFWSSAFGKVKKEDLS